MSSEVAPGRRGRNRGEGRGRRRKEEKRERQGGKRRGIMKKEGKFSQSSSERDT